MSEPEVHELHPRRPGKRVEGFVNPADQQLRGSFDASYDGGVKEPLKQTLNGRRPTPVTPIPDAYGLLNAETHALLAKAATQGDLSVSVTPGEHAIGAGTPSDWTPEEKSRLDHEIKNNPELRTVDVNASKKTARALTKQLDRYSGETAGEMRRIMQEDNPAAHRALMDSDTPHSSQRQTTLADWKRDFAKHLTPTGEDPDVAEVGYDKVLARSDRVTDTQVEQFGDFMSVPGNEFSFRIARTVDAFYRDGLQKGFSAEAMDQMAEHLNLFIGSRIIQFYNARQVMAQRMTVRVRVSLDTDPEDFEDDEETASEDEKVHEKVITISGPDDR
jgi:hypothetical protein